MPAKRKNPAETGHGASADPVHQTPLINEKSQAKSTGAGLKNSLHGNVFQLKLLVLFLIRGIKAKYQFKLGTEIPGIGGKFDDLIFRYQVIDGDSMTQEVNTERYRYLQAKHKQNEEKGKITADNLLNDNNEAFSLPKYFRSYCGEVIDGIKGCLPNNVRDCIICTNIGFDDELKLKEAGIELLSFRDDEDEILNFDEMSKKSPIRYKLKKTENLLRKMLEWTDIHLLAKTLLEYATDNRKFAITSPIFKNYHVALVEERVINKKDGKLCSTFLEGNSHFREILSEITFVNCLKNLNFKCDDNKKIRVDGMKKMNPFEEKSLENLFPKYDKNKTESMKMDFRVFEEFFDDLVSENIIDAVGGEKNERSFSANFVQEKDLSEKGSDFRGKLRNAVFIHFWKDLTFTLSGAFGSRKKNTTGTPDENKSLNDLVGEKEIGDFLDKLVFAVHTPNEVQLDDILKKELDDRYSLHENDFQSDFILRNMLDWFKKKESTFMTSAEGIDILENAKKKMKSLRLTAVSIDYQRKLKAVCGFNENSVQEMAEKLKQLLISENKDERIISELPKRTAVKVIAALKKLRRSVSHETTGAVTAPEETYFKRKDSYLMAPFSEVNKIKKYEKLKKALKSDTSHHLLIVICEGGISIEDEKYCEELVKETTIPKKVIVISSEGVGIKDDLKFTDFSNEFKKTLLSKQVTFQGSILAVADLIKTRSDQTVDELIQSGEPEEILNLDAVEELMKQEKSEIQIPSLNSSRFEKSLYIKRQLSSAFPFDNEFWEEVAKQLDMETSDGYSLEKLQRECGVNKQGEIEWNDPIVNDKQKRKIWKKINSVLERRKSLTVLPSNTLTEDNLSIVDRREKEKNPGVVIIAGAAGAGKSSILSHYYEEIKEKDPNHWVIIINFTDHAKDFLELNSYEVNLSTTIESLLNLSVIVGNSRFGRSMLRRRLNLGERITILFDGFDEIVKSQFQETAIRVISVLKENKSAGLYVTTRSHMTSNLQFRLSQLNFDLENFSKEDQINYLTSLWKRNFSGDVEDNLRHFAELLVDRISETLKDGERAFIGIPLQCRILAECFETEVQKSAQNQSKLNSLVESIDRMNLDVANLYRLLITKKRTIYEEEKKALSQTHYLADSHANSDIDNLESFLRKLAIKTIVSTKEEVHVLLGTQENSMKSENEQRKNKTKRMDHSARFGLLDENAEGKERFLHRTYAEYMMAEYLYTGFLLDDKKRNHLLDCEFARKLIIDSILAKEQYDGVQVFFNSMLKEIVDLNQEWHENINKGKLPERLFKLSEVLYRQFLRQSRKPYTTKNPNALLHSAKNKKEKIFKFFYDCLDTFFDKSDVLRAMTISFLSEHTTENFIFTLKVFRHQSIDVFQRFIRYFDSDLLDNHGKPHAETLVEKFFHGLPLTDLEDYSYWNAKEQQNMIDCLLAFMDEIFMVKKRTDADSFFQPWKEYYVEPLLAMLLLNENYENQLKSFLKILSQTTAYSNDSTLATFIKNVCSSVVGKIRQGRRLMAILKILHQVRDNLAIKVFGLLFSMEPEIFQNNFPTCSLETNDILHVLLERDLHAITPLHRAAFNNETDAIEKIILLVQENLTRGDDRYKTMAEQVVNVMCYDENGFTPFYVAAARGNEIIYCKMLLFLKHFYEKQNTSDTLEKILTATNGFVHHALSDAMESENLEMFQVILSSVKNILGQTTLLNLLKSNSRDNKSKNRDDILETWSGTIVGVACRYKDLFQTLAKIVVEQKDTNNEAYRDWNDLVFHLIDSEDFNRFTLKYVSAEILQGMLSQKGSNELIKRLLDKNIWEGFEVLSSRLIKYFSEDQLKELIMMLTHSFSDKYGCYWCKLTAVAPWLKHLDEISVVAISKFLKCVSEKLGDSFVYDLVIHDDDIVTIHSKALVNFLLPHLSQERQQEAKQHWKMNSSITIDNTFFNLTSKIFWLNNVEGGTNGTIYFKEIMWFYLDHGSESQLKNFVKTITTLHSIDGKQRSMWCYVFEKDRASINIIKYVSKKMEIFGSDAAQTLLFHVIDQNPRYLNAIWWKKDVDELLAQLPEVVQQGIRQYIQEHAFGLIEELFKNPSWLIPSDQQSYSVLNTLTFMVNYSNENQLQQFIQLIKVSRGRDTVDNHSIWYGLFRPEIEDDYIRMMGKFLKSVLEKFGSSAVKKLLLHVDDVVEGENGYVPYICSYALCGDEKVVETMLSYLDVKHREKVQRKVNKFLEKKFNVPNRRKTLTSE